MGFLPLSSFLCDRKEGRLLNALLLASNNAKQWRRLWGSTGREGSDDDVFYDDNDAGDDDDVQVMIWWRWCAGDDDDDEVHQVPQRPGGEPFSRPGQGCVQAAHRLGIFSLGDQLQAKSLWSAFQKINWSSILIILPQFQIKSASPKEGGNYTCSPQVEIF